MKKSVPIRKRSIKEEILILEVRSSLAELNAKQDTKEREEK